MRTVSSTSQSLLHRLGASWTAAAIDAVIDALPCPYPVAVRVRWAAGGGKPHQVAPSSSPRTSTSHHRQPLPSCRPSRTPSRQALSDRTAVGDTLHHWTTLSQPCRTYPRAEWLDRHPRTATAHRPPSRSSRPCGIASCSVIDACHRAGQDQTPCRTAWLDSCRHPHRPPACRSAACGRCLPSQRIASGWHPSSSHSCRDPCRRCPPVADVAPQRWLGQRGDSTHTGHQ